MLPWIAYFYVCVGSTQAACHIYVCKIMAGKHFSKGQPQKIRLQPLLNEYFHLAKCELSRKLKNVFFFKGQLLNLSTYKSMFKLPNDLKVHANSDGFVITCTLISVMFFPVWLHHQQGNSRLVYCCMWSKYTVFSSCYF